MSWSGGPAENRLLARFGRKFDAGKIIFEDGEVGSEAFLLQEGRARLIKRVGSAERSLRVVKPGDLFGESALVPGSPRNSTAVAITDCQVLALDQTTFQHVVAGTPAVGSRVLQQLIRRLRDAEDQIEILMVEGTQSRIVVSLLKLAQSMRDGRSHSVDISLSPMELSTRVGLDVDTVRRGVQKLRDSGYLEIVGEKVQVTDVDALMELYAVLANKNRIGNG